VRLSCGVLRDSPALAGDSDPAAAAALSLAVDDVAALADTSIEMLDRASSTGVSVTDK
jgi:hypothetical protein